MPATARAPATQAPPRGRRPSQAPGRAAGMAALLLAGGLLALGAPAEAAAGTMRFGMERGAVQALADLGIRPDYAMVWAGVWSEGSWGGFTATADGLADQGVQPLVQWWYWGDDISPACVQEGCWSSLQSAALSRAKWAEDAGRLADALHAGLQGRPGVVVLESEFNKRGIETWETFDGYLVDHARIFRARAPELKLVLGFGNWGPEHWSRFDRAAAAADMVGFQTMRGSTRDTLSEYLGAVDAIKAASAKLKATFGKPVLLHDLALSSYGSGYEANQEKVVKSLFARLGELEAAGISGIVYRSLKDSPNLDPANYYGYAERHWGLRRSDGSAKPALDDWVAGVKAERAGGSPAPPPPASSTSGSLEAEGLERQGGTLWSDDTALGDRAVKFYGDGWLAGDVTVPSGVYQVTVRARAVTAAGQAPTHLQLRVDTHPQAGWDPVDTAWKGYPAQVRLQAGTHRLAVMVDDDSPGTNPAVVLDQVRWARVADL